MITVSAMKTRRLKGFCGKLPHGTYGALGGPGTAYARPGAEGCGGPHEDEDERPTAGTLAAWWPYLLISRSCAGGIRGADGETTSPPRTVP